jgi:hypothetical protein
MFWTFNLNLDIWATVWATFPNIRQIFVQFSGHSGCGILVFLQEIEFQISKLEVNMPDFQ